MIYKNNFIKFILIYFVLSFLSGCGYTEEEKALMEEYEKTAKVNAVNYIEEKYGFTPEVLGTEVLKVDPGPVPDFTPSPTGYVNVKMEYENKEFLVNINGETENTDGKDSYQQNEIAMAFKERLSGDLPVNIDFIDIQYSKDYLLKEKFVDVDSFLKDLDQKNLISILILTLDDIDESSLDSINYNNMELLLISAINEDGLNALSQWDYLQDKDRKYNYYNIDTMDNNLQKYSLYMKGHVFRNMKGEIHGRFYAFKKVQEGIYFSYDKNENAQNFSIDETNDMGPASDWGRGSSKVKVYEAFENPVKVGKSYAVEFGDLSRIQIYIKEEAKGAEDEDSRYIAMQYIDEDGNEVNTSEFAPVVNGYYTLDLKKQEHMRICIMKNKK